MAKFRVAHGQRDFLPSALNEGTIYVTNDTAEVFADLNGQRLLLSGSSGGQSSTAYYRTLEANKWIQEEDGTYSYTLVIKTLMCGRNGQVPPIISCTANDKEYSKIISASANPYNNIVFSNAILPTEDIEIVIIDSVFGKGEGGGSSAGGAIYSYCHSASTEAIKEITTITHSLESASSVPEGTQINVIFAEDNKVEHFKLQVDDMEPIDVLVNDSDSPLAYTWYAGSVVTFIYTGFYWTMLGKEAATTEYAGIVKLSDDYNNQNNSIAATPKAILNMKEVLDTSIKEVQETAEAAKSVWESF